MKFGQLIEQQDLKDKNYLENEVGKLVPDHIFFLKIALC